jgi:prolyl-tRNA synthetase
LPIGDVVTHVRRGLDTAQETLLAEAQARQARRTVEATNLDDAVVAAQEGFAVVPAALVSGPAETRLNEAGVSVRCIQRRDGTLPGDDDPDEDLVAVVGRAY